MSRIPVLIVGAGPVGLSLALALARQSIPSIVVEKRSEQNPHPRARGVNVRTMELFHLWGNAERLSQYELPKEARRFIWMESLQGEEVMRVSMDSQKALRYSNTQAALVSQDHVENSLSQKLREYCAQHAITTKIYFSHEFMSFVSLENGVQATIFNHLTNEDERIEASYLIACDGAGSKVRKQIQIEMNGPGDFGQYCSVYCEFDISAFTQHRKSIGFFFTERELAGRFLASVDGNNKWIIGFKLFPGQSRKDFDHNFCINEIRKLTKIDDLPVHILDINFWRMGAQNAQQYHQGSIFLAGDAAHRLPPTGGFGMNTGIQDAHNLAWKLSYVLKNQAHHSLLDTYFEERAPIAEQNIKWSTKNAVRIAVQFEALLKGDLDSFKEALREQQANHLNSFGLDLGFIYHSKIILSENQDTLSISPSEYVPTTLPGSRAPFYELMQNNESITTLSLFENNYVWMVGYSGHKWLPLINRIIDHCQFPIFKIYLITSEKNDSLPDTASFHTVLYDPKHQWHDVYQLSSSGIVLIRPDGHIAWRSQGFPSNEKDALLMLEKVIATQSLVL